MGIFDFFKKKKDQYEGEYSVTDYSGAPIPHGRGTMTHVNGDKYEGEFKNGMHHGKGTYTWGSGPNKGDRYVGEFKDGNWNGKGTYTFKDGRKLVGEWKDGELIE